MAVKKSRNIAAAISIATLFLALLAFLFGNDVLSKFSGSKIEMESYIEGFPIPERIIEFIDDENVQLPDAIRFVTVKNNGSEPSRNLNVEIEFEGEIFQYSISAAEKFNSHESKDSCLYVDMDRLSKGAEINLVVWLRNEGKRFSGIAVDDIKSSAINYIDSRGNENKSVFNFIGLILLSLSIIIFVINANKTLNNRIEKQSAINSRNMDELMMELEEVEAIKGKIELPPIKDIKEIKDREYENLMKNIIKASKKL